MKFLIDNWSLIVVALASGGMLVWPAVARSTRSGIGPEGAVQLINRERAVVVDVGETEEFALGHINGARNIPLNQLEQRLASEVKNKTLPLILVDQSGGRAARALTMAKGLGYDKAVVLGGGLRAWKEANLPLERA